MICINDSRIQQDALKSPYHASTLCNGLKSRITLPRCVINNKGVLTSRRCYFRIERKLLCKSAVFRFKLLEKSAEVLANSFDFKSSSV